MNPIKSTTFAVAALLASFSSANAVINIDFAQVDTDVLVTFTGSFGSAVDFTTSDSLSDSVLSFSNTGSQTVFRSLDSQRSTAVLSLTGNPSGLPFTAGLGVTTPDSRTGDSVGIETLTFFGTQVTYSAPFGYQSGDPILSTMTFNSTTLADLSLPASGSGTIDFVSVGGPENVTWTINAVPEPSAFGLFCGLAAAFIVGRRRA